MRTSLITLALISAVILVSPVSVSAATNAGIKPGSFWYGFDLAFEKINLFFNFNSEGKVRKALEYADERLAEAEAVAENNNTDAVKTAITNYESNISFATEKSKDVPGKEKAEALLISIADNTLKHQEILADVLAKVPDEAKEAIIKAIEVSRKGQEEAMQNIAELKGEVEQLKKEVAELKQEKEKEQTEVIERLQREVDALKKESVPPQSSQKQIAPPATTENTEPQKNIVPPSTNIAPPNTILCNGKYWTPCPAGQRFYCPTSGDAQCLLDSSSNQNNTFESQQQLTQEIKSKTTNIESSMSTLTQLENNCNKAMQDSDAEMKRLRSLLGGADHLDILQKIYVQESYQRLLLDECVSKKIRIIDNLLVDVRAMLRIPNLPSQVSSLMNQFSDALILKRNRLVNWQFQYP